MIHTYKMKRFLTDQLLFFFIGLIVIVYILFALRRNIIFGLFVSLLAMIPIILICGRLFALVPDLIVGKKTVVAVFDRDAGAHELQFFRRNYCYEWHFTDENGKLLKLLVPEATTNTSIQQPRASRKTKITYYRFSSLLLSWEILE